MLLSLKVKNYALISDVQLGFVQGLNIITGETGAGKSILIDALGLALGNRADTAVLRNQNEKCVIEASFRIGQLGLESFFSEQDLDYDPITIIRREITPSGKSRMFVNDTPVNLRTLSELGARLIERHSQYDNLQLFQAVFQMALVDALAGTTQRAAAYRTDFEAWSTMVKDLESLMAQDAEWARERDYMQYLFDELEQAALREGEEEELEEDRSLLENAERLLELFGQATYLLDGSERSIGTQLYEVIRLLREGGSATEALSARLQSARLELDDIAGELGRLTDKVEVNPERLELVNERMSLLFDLRNKHRKDTVEQLLHLKEELEARLSESADMSSRIQELERACGDEERRLEVLAAELSTLRSGAVKEIEGRIAEEFARLGMPHSRLRLVFTAQEQMDAYGKDALDLQLSSDNGRSYQALRKSISGGELSRLNLVVKKLLAGKGQWASGIMDEIDTGVSGEIARKVGSLMMEIAGEQQLIVITHLPQIASLGQHHLFVHKEEVDGRVTTQVRLLSPEERIHAIAQMISGESLTESALEQSRALLQGR